MLIPLPGVKVFKNILGGEPDLFVNDFVKTGLKGYHKIVIPAQHWFGHIIGIKETNCKKFETISLVFNLLLFTPILDVGLITIVGVSCEASIQPAHLQAISCSSTPR
jgi:hypothetical protein